MLITVCAMYNECILSHCPVKDQIKIAADAFVHTFLLSLRKQCVVLLRVHLIVEAWCDMKILESLWEVLYVMKCSLGVPSVIYMLGRSNFSVYFRYTGRVRIFGYFLQFV